MKYPWPTNPVEGHKHTYESFFVAGFPLEELQREVFQEALQLNYQIRYEPGILNGMYGIRVTRVR